MDLFIGPEGVIIRDCGCGKHGLNSIWDEHEDDWKNAHRAEAAGLVLADKGRPALHDRGQHDAALLDIRGPKKVVTP